LEAEKPSMGWCTNMVHDGVSNQRLQLLDPALSKVLVLVVRLTLPVDLVTNFHLSSITDKLSGGSLYPDLILKSVKELLISLDGIDICYKRLHTNKNLGNGGSRVISWCVQIDGIGSN